MPHYTLIQPIQKIHGSLRKKMRPGGVNLFSSTTQSSVARSLAFPRQRRTSWNQPKRSWFSIASRHWKMLSEQRRAYWAELATHVERIDIFGQPYNLSGYMLWIMIQWYRQYNNQPLLDLDVSLDTWTPVPSNPTITFSGDIPTFLCPLSGPSPSFAPIVNISMTRPLPPSATSFCFDQCRSFFVLPSAPVALYTPGLLSFPWDNSRNGIAPGDKVGIVLTILNPTFFASPHILVGPMMATQL